MTLARSAALFRAASQIFPGGVNSPVRSFGRVGGVPRFMARGSGPYLFDVDGNRYTDYVLSWGALAHGHAHPAVVDAIRTQAGLGTTFGAPTELETALAQRITHALPSMEMLRFVSTGTEAVMSAVRLARAATGRDVILKFDGCYHGHADALLVEATLPPGIPRAVAERVVVVPYNDLAIVERACAFIGDDLAAIIVEPVAGNMGLVLPRDGFLAGLRALATRVGALLIFDEVITGFRIGWGGAQGHFGVTPDLTALGKVIGGGVPAAAYGGRRDLMSLIAPQGPVYQAGTLSGNPLSMAAGIAALDRLEHEGFARTSAAAATLAGAVGDIMRRAGIPVRSHSLGAAWGFFFSDVDVVDHETAMNADGSMYARFFHALLAEGVYLPPSPLETAFVSTVHDEAVIASTIDAFAAAANALPATCFARA